MLVPELRIVVPFPLPLNLPQTPPAPHAADQPLLPPFANGGIPRLESAPDKRFLGFQPHVAGRAVVLELYAPDDATPRQRIALWERHARESVDLRELGLCAQALERARINWRQADDVEQIIEAAHHLTQDAVAD